MSGLTYANRQLLDGTHYAALATHNPDGSVHIIPVWYLFQNDQLFVECPSRSRKARNVAARSTATLLVDIRTPGTERWVSASGTAVIITGEESREINSKIRRRYLTEIAIQDPRVGPKIAAADDATICITPTRWRSWDAQDTDRRFFGGILGSTPERWFLPVDV